MDSSVFSRFLEYKILNPKQSESLFFLCERYTCCRGCTWDNSLSALSAAFFFQTLRKPFPHLLRNACMTVMKSLYIAQQSCT